MLLIKKLISKRLQVPLFLFVIVKLFDQKVTRWPCVPVYMDLGHYYYAVGLGMLTLLAGRCSAPSVMNVDFLPSRGRWLADTTVRKIYSSLP